MTSTITVTLAAVVGGLALMGAWIFGSAWLLRRRLVRLRATRRAADADALCRAAFPDTDAANVRAAYRWVQELVAVDDVPLHPGDHLQSTLGIDLGHIEDKFEASYECYGPEAVDTAAPGDPSTVQGLMASVLAAGYEFYPTPRNAAGASANR